MTVTRYQFLGITSFAPSAGPARLCSSRAGRSPDWSASRRRSGSWRSSDAGAGRSRPRVPAVPAARATAGAAARARRCAGRPPWPALRAPAHDGADLPGQPGRVPLIAFEHTGKEPTEGLSDAVHGCAPQAPDTHNDPYTPVIERDVGHDPVIMRVHPARFDAADRTGHGPARSPRPDPDPPAPSVTSSMTSGDSPENTVLTRWSTSRTAHREGSRHAVTTESATEPIWTPRRWVTMGVTR